LVVSIEVSTRNCGRKKTTVLHQGGGPSNPRRFIVQAEARTSSRFPGTSTVGLSPPSVGTLPAHAATGIPDADIFIPQSVRDSEDKLCHKIETDDPRSGTGNPFRHPPFGISVV